MAITLCGCLLGTANAAEDTEKGKRGPGDRGQIFQSLDTDKDQAISKEEAGERWEHIGKLDKDEDGKVTVAELAAGRPGEGPGGQKGPKGNPGEFFARADKNKDEKLSQDEVPAELWERLSKLDKDEDGAVSLEELGAGRMAMGGKGGPEGKGKGGEFFDRADKNKDGKLSKDEVPAEAWERMGKLDKNGDDSVSKEELAMGYRGAMEGRGKGDKGRPGGGGGSDAIFSSLDKNNDEKLSEEEVPAEMWAKLSKADEDADGRVSKAELEKVYQARQEMMGEDNKKEERKRPDLENESA